MVAIGITAAVAASEIAIEATTSHVAALPRAILVGITSGEENGRSDATIASVESGLLVALSPMKNEARIRS